LRTLVGQMPENVNEGSATRCFVVELRYREPGYEARHGAKAEPYRFRYRIVAASEEAAVWQALAEFHEISALSGVGWTRDVVSCDVISSAG
jgi:hypothetical protein